MATKLVTVTVGWETTPITEQLMKPHERIARATERQQEQDENLSELDTLLNEGYSIVSSHQMNGSNRNLIIFVMHKADQSARDTQ